MTKLVRFSPTTDVRRMQREIDHLFNSFFPTPRVQNSEEAETAVWTPRIDLSENDESYLIKLDVPGVAKDNLNISYHEGTLTVSGERVEDKEEENTYVRVERLFGRFYRSFNLPKAIDEDKIEATYTDGVLQVLIPKTEEIKPRQIQVK